MNSTVTHPETDAPQPRHGRPVRHGVAWSYFGFNTLFIFCVILQVFFVGAGILVSGSWMTAHIMLGSNLVFLPIVLLILSFAARLPGALKWLTLLLLVLVVLQPILIFVPRKIGLPILSALHPVNALAIFTLPIFVNIRVWRLLHS